MNSFSNVKTYDSEQLEVASGRASFWEQFTKRSIVLWFQVSVAFAVLITNIVWVLWTTQIYGTKGGVGTIFTGSCSFSKSLNTYFHIAINVLSTILLGASNYCMQIISAPSRKDVDVAHASKMWLDIGVPSARNLLKLKWRYRIAWVGLIIVSAVLHLLWVLYSFQQGLN